ncbi:aldehyde dehydrogenase family protein [Streptomyces sp. NPDC093568]|uniref:aldehyde dehydrogenase family protein n=1 Tax=Streptomyces sp. NPDC093568 TaxID=3366041 RepID=UPI003803B318
MIIVKTFADEEEAVRRVNDVPLGPLGLSASVWTEDARRSHTVAARLGFGTVWVNSHLVLAPRPPGVPAT